VAVIDDNTAAGGQIWRGETAGREPAAWFERLRKSGVKLLTKTTVIDRPAACVLLCESDEQALEVAYDKIVLATGARERFLPFPGWTLPNVMGAGGLQALVKSGLPVAGKRVVVAGTGPLLLAVAAYLRKCGAEVRAVAEQAPWRRIAEFGLSLAGEPAKLTQALSLKWKLRGVPYVTSCHVVSVEGAAKVERVVLTSPGRTWTEPCDYLACGFGLVPNVELALLLGCDLDGGFVAVNEWQETSVSGVYCAGEPVGIGGAGLALAAGEIAGYAAAGRPAKARLLFGARSRAIRFMQAMDRAFELRDDLKRLATPDTIVCRCEDVPLGRIAALDSWKSAKLQTRCGMGPCQGRVCGSAVEFLLGWTRESTRPPVYPATLGHLGGASINR
jgi:NADPH-dependent 2,4-dienoyl-CoA reductase/sulfur reductase-like enzyme